MRNPASDLVIDPALIHRYDASGPRYTSYPTADRFVDAIGEESLRHALSCRAFGGVVQPLSLYVHLPFCSTLCWYCGCNKVVTRDRSRSARYIMDLKRELALLAPVLGTPGPALSQMHWGGGTPTFLSDEELADLAGAIDALYPRAPGAERSIEVDPRSTGPGRVAHLAALGFNRLSLGVQDFDTDVQRAVHRLQSEEETRRVLEEARAAGFRSVNYDLIYGLPRQRLDSFNATLDKVLSHRPDRIALYSYAHLPGVFKPQRRIATAELPPAEVKLELMTLAIGRLTGAGYRYIGMDHFALPQDELAVAQAQGRLQRNFQGYSTQPEADLIGLGVSAIGRVGTLYYQNHKALADYAAALQDGRLPVLRGVALSADDLARRSVIQSLMCHFRVSIESIELAHLLDFTRYFAHELEDLRRLAEDGLVELTPEWITVTPRGRLLVRHIAMVFDRYLRARREAAAYSRVI